MFDAFSLNRRVFGPHICGDALDILPGNGNILTGSWRKENSVQIWDFASGEKIRDVPDDFNKSMVRDSKEMCLLSYLPSLCLILKCIGCSLMVLDVLLSMVTRWTDYGWRQ